MSSMSWARFNLSLLVNSQVLTHERWIRSHTPQHQSTHLHHRRAWSHVVDPWVLRPHQAVGEQLLRKVIWLSVPLRHYRIKHSKRTWIRFLKLLYARLSCHLKVSERASGREYANECVSRVMSCARVTWDDLSFQSCSIHTHTFSLHCWPKFTPHTKATYVYVYICINICNLLQRRAQINAYFQRSGQTNYILCNPYVNSHVLNWNIFLFAEGSVLQAILELGRQLSLGH